MEAQKGSKKKSFFLTYGKYAKTADLNCKICTIVEKVV
jgi:hypothetical protein